MLKIMSRNAIHSSNNQKEEAFEKYSIVKVGELSYNIVDAEGTKQFIEDYHIIVRTAGGFECTEGNGVKRLWRDGKFVYDFSYLAIIETRSENVHILKHFDKEKNVVYALLDKDYHIVLDGFKSYYVAKKLDRRGFACILRDSVFTEEHNCIYRICASRFIVVDNEGNVKIHDMSGAGMINLSNKFYFLIQDAFLIRGWSEDWHKYESRSYFIGSLYDMNFNKVSSTQFKVDGRDECEEIYRHKHQEGGKGYILIKDLKNNVYKVHLDGNLSVI